MIQEAIAQRVLDAALETGGDFSELFMEDTETHSISMLNGTVENATYRRRTGAGVRVLKGEQSAYAYTADTSEAALVGGGPWGGCGAGGEENPRSRGGRHQAAGRLWPRDPL